MREKVFLFSVLLSLLALPMVASAYDFSATAPSGQTLYYNIIVDGHVGVVRPGTGSIYNNYVSGDLLIQVGDYPARKVTIVR